MMNTINKHTKNNRFKRSFVPVFCMFVLLSVTRFGFTNSTPHEATTTTSVALNVENLVIENYTSKPVYSVSSTYKMYLFKKDIVHFFDSISFEVFFVSFVDDEEPKKEPSIKKTVKKRTKKTNNHVSKHVSKETDKRVSPTRVIAQLHFELPKQDDDDSLQFNKLICNVQTHSQKEEYKVGLLLFLKADLVERLFSLDYKSTTGITSDDWAHKLVRSYFIFSRPPPINQFYD